MVPVASLPYTEGGGTQAARTQGEGLQGGTGEGLESTEGQGQEGLAAPRSPEWGRFSLFISHMVTEKELWVKELGLQKAKVLASPGRLHSSESLRAAQPQLCPGTSASRIGTDLGVRGQSLS